VKLLKYKTLLVLQCVIYLNVVVMFLLQGLDSFVNVGLYGYGLVFSYDWANPYWHNNLILWTCVLGATALAAASIVPHYMHSKMPGRFSSWTGFLLPSFALVFQGFGIFFLDQINSLVWSGLYDYGVQYDIDWATTYNLFSMPALALMAVAFLGLIIPAVRALGLIEIEIVDEDE
jgi:uncharacterized protein YqgC (DUF456 family)